MEDELMGAICFRITPKGDMTHYLFIFRKQDPLGIELNNATCSGLGYILYLETKKGKDDMTSLDLQQDIRRMAV